MNRKLCLETIQQHSEQNLGFKEQIATSAKEPLRLSAERAAQVKANATPSTACCCRQCRKELLNQKVLPRGD